MDRRHSLKTRIAYSFRIGALIILAAAGGLAAAPAPTKPSSSILGPSWPPASGLDPGELLLAELNCLACHAANKTVNARLAPRQSPILGVDGMTITPQYLRAFLMDPQAEKPGSTMPDVLHGLDTSAKAETVDVLVHYLISLTPPKASAPVGADQLKMQQGRLLYHQVGCVACHSPQEPASALQPSRESDGSTPRTSEQVDFTASQASSVPLGSLAKKTTVESLAKFLMDPSKVRPSGRMPSLNLSEGEATAIAIYLLREQAPGLYDPSAPRQRIQGLSYHYFEGRFNDAAPNFDAMKPRSSGVVDRFKLDSRRRNSNFGFRFTGLLSLQSEGDYTFFSESDDGSRVSIGDKLVVKNDGQHPMTEAQGALHLKPGEHPIRVTYFNGGGEWGLKVSYQGPGLPKQEIPPNVLSHFGQPMIPLGEEKLVLDTRKITRGRELFSSLSCAVCHAASDPAVTPSSKAKSLASLNPDDSAGCLGDPVRNGLPQFGLSDSQRRSLRTTLSNLGRLSDHLDAKTQVTRTMAALNCFACHSRAGVGGPDPVRADYFTSVGQVDLGDEGRLPPHLTGVGSKLRPEWLREVLLDKGTVRPYMATRMPQFGKSNVDPLAAAFEKADNSGPLEKPSEYSARLAKFGRKLVGRDGLTCVACHTFGPFKSLGVPAMDMTQMAKRLKRDWFRRYLLDPVSLRPGTRMPTFWPDGVAANKEILEGNTEQQIEAIWNYLSKGRDAEVPSGLVQAKMELVADHEAILYRNFIDGAGARAIAVGYPEKANLAFDAANLRLAMIWQGAFLDASRHRSDRGDGFVPPLGNNVIRMPPGPPFAILNEPQALWPETTGQKAGYHLRGYRLDEKRRPTFLYSFNDLQIEDYSVAFVGEVDPTITRTLVLRCGQPVAKLWFRAAVGEKIEAKSGSEYWVEGKLELKIRSPSSVRPVIRQSGGQTELLVPVAFQGNEARIVEELIW